MAYTTIEYRKVVRIAAGDWRIEVGGSDWSRYSSPFSTRQAAEDSLRGLEKLTRRERTAALEAALDRRRDW